MSKDPSTRVGAVIVGPDLEIRSTGFNGFPRGIADTPARLHDRETKLRLVVHAECNAIVNAARVGTPLRGCTMYLSAQSVKDSMIWGGPPCTRCTVHTIQAGIARVISHSFKNVPSKWKQDIDEARKLLEEANIPFIEVNP